MVFIYLFNESGCIIDNFQIEEGESIMDAIIARDWSLEAGDTIKIVRA